jgi:hypothetical protein
MLPGIKVYTNRIYLIEKNQQKFRHYSFKAPKLIIWEVIKILLQNMEFV